MRNLKDERTKIFPSTTMEGEDLPSSSALDSPSVLSKLATPTPAIDSDMSHVINDATLCMMLMLILLISLIILCH